MKRVLILSTTTGYQLRSFADAARVVGATLLFASDRCDQLHDPWFDQAIPVRFFDEHRSALAVLAACGSAMPHAVLALGDRPTTLAAHLTTALGLPGNDPAAAVRSRVKFETRRAFQDAGLLTPSFRSFSIDDDPQTLAWGIDFPAVLKPLAMSGSRGVMRVDGPEEFITAFKRLRTLLDSADVRMERDSAHRAALVETFIPGAEYAIEGVLTRGVFTPFAVFDKPDALDGPFFEETIYVTPSRQSSAVQQQIVSAVAAAAAAIGLYHGPIHAECRVNDCGVYVLEVAARPIGGLCARALRFASATHRASETVSLEEVLLRHALGENIDSYQRESPASGVMMIPIPVRGVLRGVQGTDVARAVPGVDDVRITAKQDALIVPLPEGRSYLGFIFARGDDPLSVEYALREAHARLEIVVDREVPVLNVTP